MNEKVRIQVAMKDIEKAISDLQKVIQSYLETIDHSRLLTVALINLERDLLNDFFVMAREDPQAEMQDEDEGKGGMVNFQNPGKKDLLH